MKRFVIAIGVIGFILVVSMPAHAWLFGKKKAQQEAPASGQQTPAAETPKAGEAPAAVPNAAQKAKDAKAIEDMLKAKMALSQKKMNEIDNTDWQIELTPMAGKGKKEADTVTFKNKQVSVASYAKKGFPTTNFTLTVQPDGTSIWETMQTSEKAGIAFWRGEFDAKVQTMRGVLSHQMDAKTKVDYSFISTVKKSVAASGR